MQHGALSDLDPIFFIFNLGINFMQKEINFFIIIFLYSHTLSTF